MQAGHDLMMGILLDWYCEGTGWCGSTFKDKAPQPIPRSGLVARLGLLERLIVLLRPLSFQ
jgi:hypothetical protein